MGRGDVPVYKAHCVAREVFNNVSWHGPGDCAGIAHRIRAFYFGLLPGEAKARSALRGKNAQLADEGVPSKSAIEALRSAVKEKSQNLRFALHAKVHLEGEHANGIRGVLRLPVQPYPDEARKLCIAVFCQSHLVSIAMEAGATAAGGAELAVALQSVDPPPGALVLANVDRCIATHDTLGVAARLARVLGPRGIMPTAKTGTLVRPDAAALAEAVVVAREAIPIRVEKDAAAFAAPLGPASWPDDSLNANLRSALEYLAAQRRTVESGRFVESAFVAAVDTQTDSVVARVPIVSTEFGAAKGARYVQALEKLRAQVALRKASVRA